MSKTNNQVKQQHAIKHQQCKKVETYQGADQDRLPKTRFIKPFDGNEQINSKHQTIKHKRKNIEVKRKTDSLRQYFNRNTYQVRRKKESH